jgi:hypothetical protein
MAAFLDNELAYDDKSRAYVLFACHRTATLRKKIPCGAMVKKYLAVPWYILQNRHAA